MTMASTTVDRNIELMRRAYDTLQQGDLDATGALLTEDFIANLPGLPDPVVGREIWRLGVQAMREGFPDLRTDIEDIFGVGDKVAVRLRFHGTHDGPFQGIPPTHRPVSFTSIEIYRVEGDKIAEEWVSPDMTGLMGQITAPDPS
jgi:steroid delta-isomerase-like uncharacterized protein